MKFTTGHLLLKMKYVPFIVRLEGHTKHLTFIMDYGKNRLLCFLMKLLYLKHKEIDMRYLSAIQHTFCRIWKSNLWFSTGSHKRNSFTIWPTGKSFALYRKDVTQFQT